MKIFHMIIGFASLILGVIGIFLPLLPTTPFLLLSAFCLGRSSERLHTWLITHPQLGKPIHDWQTSKSISKNAKRSAMIVIFISIAISIALDIPTAMLIIQIIILTLVSTFILTRPSNA